MKEAMKTAMTTSISEVLETMFYMSLEFSDQATLEEDVMKDTVNTTACKIDFKGRISGYFVLFIPDKLLLDMTENFMGLDKEDITDEHSSGTLKEAINMLAGSALSGFDDKVVFQLSIPEIIDIGNATSAGKGKSEEEIVIVTETIEGYLAIKAVIESE